MSQPPVRRLVRYKTLFRVLLKAIGVWMIFDGVLSGVQHLLSALSQWAASNVGLFASTASPRLVFNFANNVPWFLASLIHAGLKIALGFYLFFGGGWIVNLAVPGNRPYCHECGYDLSGTMQINATACPECGTAFKLTP